MSSRRALGGGVRGAAGCMFADDNLSPSYIYTSLLNWTYITYVTITMMQSCIVIEMNINIKLLPHREEERQFFAIFLFSKMFLR